MISRPEVLTIQHNQNVPSEWCKMSTDSQAQINLTIFISTKILNFRSTLQRDCIHLTTEFCIEPYSSTSNIDSPAIQPLHNSRVFNKMDLFRNAWFCNLLTQRTEIMVTWVYFTCRKVLTQWCKGDQGIGANLRTKPLKWYQLKLNRPKRRVELALSSIIYNKDSNWQWIVISVRFKRYKVHYHFLIIQLRDGCSLSTDK